VFDEHVIFFEAAGIEQDAEPLAGGQPALGVLRRDALRPAPLPRGLAALLEFLDRGCHSADRPHLGDARAVLSRAAQPVNRAARRMLQRSNDGNGLTSTTLAEP
jgi:hypothetical protein